MAKNPDYLNDVVQELHVESRHWLSVIELWKFEINFFQMLLDKAKATDVADKDQLKIHQSQTAHYASLLPQLEKELQSHEHSLKLFAEGDQSFNQYEFREMHIAIRKRIKTLFQEVKDLKASLFSWVEPLI
jgi:hypothetical protein